jgi:uncharacterized integral membrane protein
MCLLFLVNVVKAPTLVSAPIILIMLGSFIHGLMTRNFLLAQLKVSFSQNKTHLPYLYNFEKEQPC